jgi:plastocyanin
MKPRRIIITALAAGALLVAAPAFARTHASSLVGVSGPGFTIEVTQGGKDVKTLKAGTYTIRVEDKSSIHNFRLKGPGVNKATTVPFQGTQTWKVTLKKGTYTYQCDVHAASGMEGTFRVT